jgi:peptidoglycan hydrolase-like protein with peptidoglycan-binding domain
LELPLIGIANLSGLSHQGEGIMTESTDQVNLDLPHLKKDSDPPPEATARVQHIFNDLAKAHHETPPRPFPESGEFGPKTEARVKTFQQENRIYPAKGEVGPQTWKALLESWVALPTHPLPPHPAPPHPVD